MIPLFTLMKAISEVRGGINNLRYLCILDVCISFILFKLPYRVSYNILHPNMPPDYLKIKVKGNGDITGYGPKKSKKILHFIGMK